MNSFEMVILIVIVVMGTNVLTRWLKTKEKQAEAAPRVDPDVSADRVNALEERIAVLERLATDKKHRLADEIDAL